MIKTLKKHWKIISILLFLCLVLIGLDMFFSSQSYIDIPVLNYFGNHHNNLLQGLFTNIIGALLVLVFIDSIIEQQKEKEKLPKKIIMYELIRKYFDLHFLFWYEAQKKFGTIEITDSALNFISEDAFKDFLTRLNIYEKYGKGESNDKKWGNTLAHMMENDIKNGNLILNRYSDILEPKLYADINNVTNSEFVRLTSTSEMIFGFREKMGISDVNPIVILAEFSNLPESNYYTGLIGIKSWLDEFYEEHKKEGLQKLDLEKYLKETKK